MKQLVVNAVCDDALGDSDGVAIAAKIASGEVSAAEVTEAAIARAERVNPMLNAIVANRFDQARQQAASPLTGALAGIPTFVKDNSDLLGMPTRHGSRASSKKNAIRNSAFVDQLLSTGLVCLGKSTLPEFGLPPTTESLFTGATCNPWNTEHTTGGSSGGSAALVAAGVVPIAHANDGGGSIRIPAACCGLVGLKPTRNRLVNHDGTSSLPINVVQEGIVSRTVRDTSVFMAEAEKHFRNPELPELGRVEAPGSKRLRVAFLTDSFDGVPVSQDTSDTLQSTARLCESLGHHAEEIPFPFTHQIADDFLFYYGMLFFGITRFGKRVVSPDFDRTKVEKFSYDFGSQFSRRIHCMPFILRRLKRAINITESIHRNYDVLLCPTVTSAAPKNGHLFDPSAASPETIQRILKFAPFTGLQNITGEPAISLPMGMSSEGLPIGMQFSSRFGEDRVLIELALELEQAQPWPKYSTVV